PRLRAARHQDGIMGVSSYRISFAETLRVRDVEEAPDGTIWFTSEGRSAVYRIFPPGWKAQSEWPCVTQ
ncbi:MAG: hypothetical protein OXE84_13250, partial [Rhodobacteraceae bacterium]|nr:hypothetical protein [Paracoccaceae bacterium]